MNFVKKNIFSDRINPIGLLAALMLVPGWGCINERSLEGLLCDGNGNCPGNLLCDSKNHCVLMDMNSTAPEPTAVSNTTPVSKSAPSDNDGGKADADASSSSPDAGPADASAPSDAGLVKVDPGCDSVHPTRLWPTVATPAMCLNSKDLPVSTTGAQAPNWTVYNGCASTVTFTAQAGKELSVLTSGDGCGCTNCVLWHIAYVLEEPTTDPIHKVQVQVPDSSPCVAGKNLSNTQLFTPETDQVKITTIPDTSGHEGFYFQVCTDTN